MSISIIIPVLNEEQAIGPCLDSLSGQPDLEILVVDGGSTDQTLRRASRTGVSCISSAAGRGTQQNTGAKAAAGDILLFLHCDTRLPRSFAANVQVILQQKGVAAGAFKLAINAQGSGYRFIEYIANLRSRALQLPYGDQALFMKRETYFAADGFPDQPILEDIAILSRVKQHGRIVTAATFAVTSARRWQQHGIVKTTLVNQLMLAGWAMGISPNKLARWYYRRQS